ncbi:hypothetical protein [Streptomyces sp. B21-083]|uniref:hypothetical protein n=1 Tax=Streptomyces sp. B21-083 TaxID=3039410 RepID=UPI002FEF97FC
MAVPEGSDAQWQDLEKAWQSLGQAQTQQRETPSVSEAQSEFLDTVDRLIDATEEITTREERAAAPFPYQRLTTTGGKRSSTPQSVYEFHLVGPELPPAGAFVRIQGDTESRGKVNRAAGRSVTVRFDQPVSWERLPARGALELIPSSVIFNKQRQASARGAPGTRASSQLWSSTMCVRSQPQPHSRTRNSTPNNSTRSARRWPPRTCWW